ncbi:uncharacterized protein LOC128554071, partial [Mercenaria mercenaria]|uniref:uncharacterized protein LOC128554071 n=1 Tax=Mercenaria mercenaria TaxID=6596 RepID=UPI00234E3BBE
MSFLYRIKKYSCLLTKEDDGGYKELAISNQTGCTGVQHAYIIHSAASYRDNLFQDVIIPDTNPAELKAAAFSVSGLYKEIQSQTDANENVLVDVEKECRNGIITYKTDQAVADHYSVTRHFAAAVCGLPDNYDKKAYTDFLAHWGTHVITEVYTGKKEIKRYQMAKSDIFSLVSDTDPHLIKEAGPYKTSGASVTLNTTAFYGSHAASSISGNALNTINIGSDVHTDVIGLQLTPISEAFSAKYWK